ncbi:hypothetical protein EVAR_28624_1 [Eumeta japonica]|uniref:Uncharacterized protein n=1 Tax=Eumeta variegata TaxID=151549 RepID=A0A4C1XX06_EUMVA|nr:hypothetical protein EVAR_28624_1 [Eumeta japonica]
MYGYHVALRVGGVVNRPQKAGEAPVSADEDKPRVMYAQMDRRMGYLMEGQWGNGGEYEPPELSLTGTNDGSCYFTPYSTRVPILTDRAGWLKRFFFRYSHYLLFSFKRTGVETECKTGIIIENVTGLGRTLLELLEQTVENILRSRERSRKLVSL